MAAGDAGKAGCPTAGFAYRSFPQLKREYNECQQWRTEVIARLSAERPRLVVVSMWRHTVCDRYDAGFSAYDPGWIDSLTRLVQAVA